MILWMRAFNGWIREKTMQEFDGEWVFDFVDEFDFVNENFQWRTIKGSTAMNENEIFVILS